MALSIANKALVGAVSTVALSGVTYGVYSQFSTTSDIREALIKASKTPLDLDATTGEDFEHWQELAKQHHSNKPAGKTKIVGLNLTSDNDINGLKEKCKLLLETKIGHADYEKNLSVAESWCTKENAPRKIATLLGNKDRVLLKNDSTDNWDTQWQAFKKKYETENPSGNWEIAGWDRLKREPSVATEFKTKCITNSGGSLMPNTENTFLKEIEDYCTKPKG
ncbi:hypothetical protein A6V39_03520 [Candidatus Mycoplasma haematobovis]|uniref:Uncharacterized protein n=1 Tax=Candidatus Mycoplasma haematobovis TaxID=432608 RepID=A0A1A9QDC4_9MOLU|nr:hypothetical protein [Candidatus Mycoplasma haematobovis]OAL09955.1 hypothetical protein A6V39_03520 [Candidatus Mycoplasma haematobovis]